MPKYTKPIDPNVIWASTALSSDVVKPDNSKIIQGWIQEKPPLETENWLKNKLFLAYAYYNQLGIPEWDSNTEYQAGKSYVQGADGLVYKALVTNTNANPAGGGGSLWELAFVESRAVSTYARALIGATNEAKARQVLGLGSASGESDDKYLHRSNNLNDVANKQAAFVNIKQDATTTRTGVVELSTRQETAEGVREDLAVTPNSLGGGINPSGTIITFAGQAAPTGYLKCDGRLLSRTEYPGLFSAIATTYGTSNSTNFRIPDTRGMFVRGWDDGRNLDSNRALGSDQQDSLKSHSHSGSTASAGNHSHSGSTSSAGSHSHSGSTGGAGAHRHTVTVGDGGAHNHSGSASNAGGHGHGLSISAGGYHAHTGNISGSGKHSHTYADSYFIESHPSNRDYFRTNRRKGSGDTDSDNTYIYYINRTTQDSGSHTHGLSISPGGNHSHSGTANAVSDHSHTITFSSSGGHTHAVNVGAAGNHEHNFTTNTTGGGETRPTNIAFLMCIKI
jgi:microcystin-dependent protein